MRWCGLVALGLALGCTVGEARPDGTPTPAVEAPGEVSGRDAEANASAAAELLSQAERAYGELESEAALELAMRVLEAYPAAPAAGPARLVGARAAFSLGRYGEARRLAEAYARAQPSGSTAAAEGAALAAAAADALAAPAASAAVGVLLPRTGSRILVQYGDWVLEGIELAVREAERRQGRSIRVVVADDAGGARTRAAVSELERQGVMAIVGPLLPENLPAASAARSNRSLVLVSPTVAEAPVGSAHMYTVNAVDTRGARELARYAARLGLDQAAILHARAAGHEAQARAFASEYRAAGGTIRATVPYDSGTTTFATHMRRILEAVDPRPAVGVSADTAAHPGLAGLALHQKSFALFVAAPDRDVPQIAPQVSFYGLDDAGVQLLGAEEWTAAPVRRMVPRRDLEGVIAVSRFAPERAEGLADPEFVRLYETAYRRSLPNQLPALGYDAANLVLQALPNRSLTAAATALRFQLLTGVRGATGVLSVRGSGVVRAGHLVVIRNGRLEAAPYTSEYGFPVDPSLGTPDAGPEGRAP